MDVTTSGGHLSVDDVPLVRTPKDMFLILTKERNRQQFL